MSGYGDLYGDQYGAEGSSGSGGLTLAVQDQDPASGETGTPIDGTVFFSIVDDVQVVLSSIRVYVNTVLIFDGTTFSSGWGGSSYAGNSFHGWDFTLAHTSYFDPGSLVTVRVTAQDSSENSVDVSWAFEIAADIRKANIQIKSVAVDVLRVYFPEPVVTTSDLMSLSNYTITTLTEGADDVTVTLVRGFDAGLGVVDFVDVHITRVTKDALYRLEVKNQHNANHLLLSSGIFEGMTALFMGRLTKTDSMRQALSQMFDTRGVGSTLLQVLIALALEDERVGGQGDLGVMPIPVPPPTTFGTATYGTDTYDGLTAL